MINEKFDSFLKLFHLNRKKLIIFCLINKFQKKQKISDCTRWNYGVFEYLNEKINKCEL